MATEAQVLSRIRSGRLLTESQALAVLQKEVRKRGEPGPIEPKVRLPSLLAGLFQTTLTHCGMRTLEFKVHHWHSTIGYFWIDWFVCSICGLAVADDGPSDECV